MVSRNIKVIVEMLTYIYCLAELFGRKLKISIHAVVLIILDVFLLTGIFYYGFPMYLHSLTYIGMFLYALLYYREKIRVTLVNCFLAAMILTIMQLVFCLPFYFFNVNTYENQDRFGLLINIICILFLLVFREKLRLNNLSNFFLKRDKVILIISVLILAGLGINLYQIWSNGFILGEQYMQLTYFLLLLAFTVGELQKARTDAEKKKMQLEMNELYYGAYDQLIMLVRERQHDTKNHINAILSMIYTTDNYEELTTKQKEYCDFVVEQNEETRLLLSSGNPLVVGFLYSKIQKAKGEHIIVNYQINMKNKNVRFPEYELVEIIGILFDNAVEALMNERELERKLYVSIEDEERELKIVIANVSSKYEEDMTERFFEAGYSSKGNGRGIGLSKLKRVVNDRKGSIAVSNKMYNGENYLIFEVVLP